MAGADERVADAAPDNWVDRLAPAPWRPYLRLSRADRPIGTWLLLIPCWLGLALACAADPAGWGLKDAWIFVACAAGAFLMRGAGCTWNDIADRRIDAQVARTRSRPIPSGQVSVRAAAIWMAAQALAAFAILLTFNGFAIALGIASLAPVAIYPFMKRVTWWPQLFLGIAFNWGALLGWAAHAGALAAAPAALYLSLIAWTIFYDTIYAHQDKEDDALIGVKSTARLFGANTGRALLVFLILATTGAMTAGVLATVERGGLAPLAAIAGSWAFGWRLAWQLRRLDPDDPARCLALFRDARNAGLLLFAGYFAAGWL
ncbi:4-hydroxybenzoate octaprenyltransferase [Oceanicella actignis]|nr:4-hydroxybenzoate octaprenyltransferase [Oceanicella actignis]